MPNRAKKIPEEKAQWKRDRIIQKLMELDEFEEEIELFDSS